MREKDGAPLYSATDLINFLGCSHATFLDLQQLKHPVKLVPTEDAYLELLQKKGIIHEINYLESLRKQGLSILEIDKKASLEVQVTQTRKAMAEGIQVIYQGALSLAPWHGYSDFLLRVDNSPSKLGSFSYEVADTKLSQSAKPQYIIQLCVYSMLVAAEQNLQPQTTHIVLGNSTKVSVRTADFMHYYEIARQRFEGFVSNPPPVSSGEPCKHCEMCRWKDRCENEWKTTDHLSFVANITGGQIKKLRDAGVDTMKALAQIPTGNRIPKMQDETLQRLREQAQLQIGKRETGQDCVMTLPLVVGKGFARLPTPDDGDLFFDMEGDPLYENGGLEYLFGFILKDTTGEMPFVSFWAHDRQQEKAAFEKAVDFIMTRLRTYPGAHIYHYASYEESALKRLAMFHGTRESQVDTLLRQRKLVDLYKVVREAIRVSEPAYSIKNLEIFYAGNRSGEVQNAGDSIVVYEKWRQLGEEKLLNEIADYNEVDCRSTLMCRDWLLGLRPATGVEWFTVQTEAALNPEREAARHEAEARTNAVIDALIAGVLAPEQEWRRLAGQLLEFHRREAKPKWWATFTRQEMNDEELIDDAECIGGLSCDPNHLPYKEKRSTVYSFRFPAQDFKMREGDDPLRNITLEPAGEIVALDEDNLTLSLKLGPSRSVLPDTFSLIPKGPLTDEVLRAAVYRYVETIANNNDSPYIAITSMLRKALPKLKGRAVGQAIISDEANLLTESVEALGLLENSYMLIQGPPGTGKTYTSSHAIVELLAQGKRIGVASNSHKAINNLLTEIENVTIKRNMRFRGIKKSSQEDQYFRSHGFIENTTDNSAVENGNHQLVAGTAWLFAREALNQAFDYLFIDEAGQVSLANVIAMGVSAKNIVLVGDQMQLSQPIQGAHPGDSGKSALEYLLDEHATVPPERGIFLGITRRMHPDVCTFISDAFYDSRLKSEADNAQQHLILSTDSNPSLPPTGLSFIPVEHAGNAQRSEEEAEQLRQVYNNLIGQCWVDSGGLKRTIGINEILVVSPYNMQVNLLRQVLPEGARVGTVDKFQGQEAPVVLISMATSSGEDLPRNIEFLYSSNRLNVAISRARCLAIVFASPDLLEVSCNSLEQMRLVNTLCWVKNYADKLLASKASLSAAA